MDTISRKEALGQGLKRYFTGKPCKNGHFIERRVSGGHCVECILNSNKSNRDAHIEEARRKERGRYSKDSSVRKAISIKYYTENSGKVKRRVSEYRKVNPDKACAYVNKRRAAKLQRTPPWLTENMLSDIQSLYKESSAKSTPHHVDHIVPLQGKLVSGLHVPWNLQVIPAEDNLRKSNKY